jgi:hypothetical protein
MKLWHARVEHPRIIISKGLVDIPQQATSFDGAELLASCRNVRLKDHRLLAVRGYFCGACAVTFHTSRPFLPLPLAISTRVEAKHVAFQK